MAYALAALAAFSNALSSVLQRIAVQHAPSESTLSLSLIRYAFRHVVWFVGLALIAAGFLLQAVALRFGNLTEVQPIVTTELLFLVLILGTWFRYRLTWRELAGASAAAGGLAAFLVLADPGGGTVIPGARAWIELGVVVGTLVVVFSALGLTGPRWFRAAMFGVAGALLFAVSAALTKQFTNLVSEGWGHVFTTWDPYALVGCGVVGLFLAQNAYHAGPITASQSTLTIVDPLASVFMGIYLFHDHLDATGWRLPVELVAMVVVIGGVLILSTSPLVAGARDDTSGGDTLARQPPRRHLPTAPATAPSSQPVS